MRRGGATNGRFFDLFRGVAAGLSGIDPVHLVALDADDRRPGRVIVRGRAGAGAGDVEIQREPVVVVFRQAVQA